MVFKINTTLLYNALAKAGAACAGVKTTLSILRCVYFHQVDGEIHIIGSDAERWLELPLQLSIEQGEWKDFCLPIERILPTFQSYPDQDVSVDVSLESSRITFSIVDENGKTKQFVTPIFEADNYPIISFSECQHTLVTSGKRFYSYIKEASKYLDNNSARPILSCVRVDVTPTTLTVVGTDSCNMYRNIIVREPADDKEETYGFNIPRNVVAVLQHVVDDAEDIQVMVSDSVIKVTSGSTLLVARLMEGRFPNYNAVIPKNCDKYAILNLAAFRRSLKVVKLFASQASNITKLTFEPMFLDLEAEDIDFGNKAKETTDYVLIKGVTKPESIGVHAEHMLSMLSDIQTENVKLSFISCDRPMIVEEDSEDSRLILLAMPMLLNI